MRKEAPQYNQLPDGSCDFGNRVIGPSLLDIRRANATASFENPRALEARTKDNGDLIFFSSEISMGKPIELSYWVGNWLKPVAITVIFTSPFLHAGGFFVAVVVIGELSLIDGIAQDGVDAPAV